jgi:site-specific DNA-methyltransferase (adenine-specific)
MARKPLGGRTVAANVLEHGTGALNVDGCRVAADGENFDHLKGRPLMKINNRRTDEESLNGAAQQAALAKLKDLGRWPANLIHDGSDEVVGLFPEANSARANGNPNNPKRGTNHTATSYGQGDGKTTHDYRDTGSAARFFYCAKASKADRDEGNSHPTVKPTELMRYLCRLVTPPGGVVLDPFMGSGSTGKAAALEGFRFIGIEREAEYLEIARGRIQLPEQGALL